MLFSQTKENLSQLFPDVLIRFHGLHILGAGAARNREIMEPVKTLISNRLNHP